MTPLARFSGAGAKRMRLQAHRHANSLQGPPIVVLSLFKRLGPCVIGSPDRSVPSPRSRRLAENKHSTENGVDNNFHASISERSSAAARTGAAQSSQLCAQRTWRRRGAGMAPPRCGPRRRPRRTAGSSSKNRGPCFAEQGGPAQEQGGFGAGTGAATSVVRLFGRTCRLFDPSLRAPRGQRAWIEAIR